MDDIDKYLSNQQRLWSLTAMSGDDAVTASGWKSTKDKQPFSQDEMDEMANNVYLKLKPQLSKKLCDVLEIGVGSGQILSKVAPYAKSYDATDLSAEVLDACRRFLQQECKHIHFHQLFAHEIDGLDRNYDIIIINSVMQYFASDEYAYDVLAKCREKLKPEGMVFCGDIMDAGEKDALIEYVSSGGSERNNFSKVRFYCRSFFADAVSKCAFSRCEITNKIYTIPNELSLFRYDALLYYNA